jgi:hypothetical protein
MSRVTRVLPEFVQRAATSDVTDVATGNARLPSVTIWRSRAADAAPSRLPNRDFIVPARARRAEVWAATVICPQIAKKAADWAASSSFRVAVTIGTEPERTAPIAVVLPRNDRLHSGPRYRPPCAHRRRVMSGRSVRRERALCRKWSGKDRLGDRDYRAGREDPVVSRHSVGSSPEPR